MDDRLEEEHDFKKTIREAADLGDDRVQRAHADRLDAELAYEALAVDASMGMFGMEESVSELMRLAMTQELLYKLDAPKDERDR